MNIYKLPRISTPTQLVLRLLLVMVFYTISRVFFFLFNKDFFDTVTISDFFTILRGGLIFDRTATLYTNILVLVLSIIPLRFRYKKIYQDITHYIFIICNSICLIINSIDIAYYQFTMRRTTATIFNEFKHDNNIAQIFKTGLLDFWDIAVFTIVIIVVFIFLANKLKYASNKTKSDFIFYPLNLAFMLIATALFIGGVRGGFKHSTRPITLSNASKYITEPNQRAIVLNTPFAIIRTWGKNSLEKQNFFTKNELRKYFNAEKPACSGDSSLSKPNVIVIILESFGRANIGYLNTDIENYKGYTPFLDSISQHCYSFKNAFANGRKSIDALPSSMASIPSINEPFILSVYSGNSVNSLASLLKNQNYYSAFFHGAPNGSMGFDAFMKQIGFNDYFGKDEYNNNSDFDNIWGIWDEPFLQYFAKTMNTFKEPFLSAVFTVSSHHPFKVPEQYKDTFPKGDVPLHQCIGYTDNALRKFFNTCKTMPWFNNSIFIITADHMSQQSINKYNTDWGNFAIPMMIYIPGNEKYIGFNDSTFVQQTDILPTVMNLVGCKTSYISFGNDMFAKNSEHYIFNYKDGAYILIEDGYYLQFDGKKTIGIYNILNDEFMTTNLINQNTEIQHKLENRIKAIIQEYSDRLINNKLTTLN